MFNLEKLVKTPINTGHRHIETNGACCAFGLAFVASTPNQVDYSPSPSECAIGSYDSIYAKHNIGDYTDYYSPKVLEVLKEAETKLLVDKQNPESVKKWMIDQLVALGVTDVKEYASA